MQDQERYHPFRAVVIDYVDDNNELAHVITCEATADEDEDHHIAAAMAVEAGLDWVGVYTVTVH